MASRTSWSILLLCAIASWVGLKIADRAGLNVFTDGAVRGRVTYGGKPITDGTIAFSPTENGQGETAYGVVGKDGHFTIRRDWRKSDGRPTGYKVFLCAPLLEF